jgi:catechol 2,3-dioxygenase-like lactoylglutathione lyase family enzyme
VKIEHVAYQVQDPAAFARWYVAHLGLTIKRVQPDPPFGHFLADDGDAVMLEVYNNPTVAVPDYASINPFVLHVAFTVPDVAGTRERLIAAGATPEGDVQVSPAGDHLAMLRDPWGLPIQLVRRATPMLR